MKKRTAKPRKIKLRYAKPRRVRSADDEDEDHEPEIGQPEDDSGTT